MKHPGPDQLVDLLDDAATPATREHVASCASCAARVDELRAAMNLAARIEVPEPSPLFWDHLSARVLERIAEEPKPSGTWTWRPAFLVRPWTFVGRPFRVVDWRWAVAVALALGVLVMFVSRLTIPDTQPATVQTARATTADAALEPLPMDEDSWALLTSMSEGLTWDEAADAGLSVAPGAAEVAALQLTAAEQNELVRLLRAEIGTSGI